MAGGIEQAAVLHVGDPCLLHLVMAENRIIKRMLLKTFTIASDLRRPYRLFESKVVGSPSCRRYES